MGDLSRLQPQVHIAILSAPDTTLIQGRDAFGLEKLLKTLGIGHVTMQPRRGW